ncbi:MAG TPA: hypothetical protein VGF85_11420, partial [Opitutaceae bacterium]
SLPAHAWRFFRSGGLDQALLATAQDLTELGTLDQKLWVALSCPVKGLQIDERTLVLMDTDADGHVRPPELIAAVSWACARLKDPATLLKGAPELPTGELASGPEGQAVAEAARWVLAKEGKTGTTVTAAEAAAVAKAIATGPLKGDGILRPEAATDDATRALIEDIASCCGSVTEASVAGFEADLKAFKAWSESGGPSANVLGPAAAEAFAAVDAVRAKVEDYFARTRLAVYDPSAIAGLNRREEDYRAIGTGELASGSPVIAALPLARIEPGRPLPLLEGVNPAWSPALERLQRAAVGPLLGASVTQLTPGDWAALSEKLRPYDAWVGSRPTTGVAKLGLERANAILSGPAFAALAALFAEDKTLAPRVASVADLERLALFYRDLGTILRNFVNFSDFYSRVRPAVFQSGTLYMDSRSCRLCIRVDDVGAHAVFAGMSRIYIAYVECRRAGSDPIKVAAAFTQGDSDYLFVGRNGIYYDSVGRDWDATVVKITESPISLRQSFLAPYKKVAAFVEGQFAKFAASKDQAVEGKLTAAAAAAPVAGAGPSPAFDIGKFAGIFAAIGLAVGAIGAALASVFSGLLHLLPWEWPLAVIAALLIISGPSMLLAALKLRQRTLGPLLEGTGWAVNGRVKINMPLGRALTDCGVLPPGSEHLAADPYEDEAAHTRLVVIITLLVLAVVWLILARFYGHWPF